MNILRLLRNEELTTKTTQCLWENLHKVQLIKSNVQRVFFCDHKKFQRQRGKMQNAKCKMTTRATVVSPAHQSETNALMQIADICCTIQSTAPEIFLLEFRPQTTEKIFCLHLGCASIRQYLKRTLPGQIDFRYTSFKYLKG